MTKDKFSSEVYEDKAGRIFFSICFCSAIAYARSLMLVLMLMSMLMSHAPVDLFVLSFVLPCAYAYVASENQASGFIKKLTPVFEIQISRTALQQLEKLS